MGSSEQHLLVGVGGCHFRYFTDICPIFYRYISNIYQYIFDIYRYFTDIFPEIQAHACMRYTLNISQKY